MEIAKEYITDKSDSIKNVVIDFTTFRAIEEVLDQELEDAMLEVQGDDELTLSEAMKLNQ